VVFIDVSKMHSEARREVSGDGDRYVSRLNVTILIRCTCRKASGTWSVRLYRFSDAGNPVFIE